MKTEEIIQKEAFANKTFTPSTPINSTDLFLGRLDLISKVIDTISRPGQHVIMFGERGVGKTSLGNVISSFLPWGDDLLVVKVNCSTGTNFSDLWKTIFRVIELESTRKKHTLANGHDELYGMIKHLVDKENDTTITPSDVCFILQQLPAQSLIIIDELDRLEDQKTIADIADTVKALSDYAVPSTLVLIGVGDSISDLVEEHASITRALAQVPVPRMSKEELEQIVTRGVKNLNMEMDSTTKDKIVEYSQGLPHFTHLLALGAVKSAIKRGVTTITDADFNDAVRNAIESAQESIRQTYAKAITVPRGKNYGAILLACALAKPDEHSGTFAPADVGRALVSLTKKEWPQAAFTKHLHEFSSDKQGNVLIKLGVKGQFRYKFRDPMMQPFIVLKGKADNRLPE